MSKEDVREKIEEHRQSIEVEEEPASRLSRSKRKNKKKRPKFPLMSTLTFILIGIPLMILIYVWGFYTPEQSEETGEKNDSILEVQTNTTASASINEKRAVNDSAKVEENELNGKGKSDQQVEQLAKEEEKKKRQAEQAAEQKAEEERKKQQEKAEAEKQRQEEQAKKASQQTHVVQSNENLYRIAMKYYGDPSGVEKIKSANNLRSEIISVGQTLIIP